MKISDGKLCFGKKERQRVRKYYIEGIMNEENERNGRNCSRRSARLHK